MTMQRRPAPADRPAEIEAGWNAGLNGGRPQDNPYLAAAMADLAPEVADPGLRARVWVRTLEVWRELGLEGAFRTRYPQAFAWGFGYALGRDEKARRAAAAKRRKRAERAAGHAPGLARERRNGAEVAAQSDDRGTAERAGHDRLAEEDHVVEKELRRVVRAEDTIGRLLRNRSIDKAMAAAARDFQTAFHMARLDQLRAIDLLRSGGGGKGEPMPVLQAREKVAARVAVLGGFGAPAANAVWFVIGCGYSIEEWARRERFGAGRSLNPERGRGILIGALSALQAFG